MVDLAGLDLGARMPRDSERQKRPADAIGRAAAVAKLVGGARRIGA